MGIPLAKKQSIIERYHHLLAQVEEQARFRQSLFSALAVGVCAIDAEGCIVELNAAYEQLLGHKRAELLGQPVWKYCPADDAHQLRQRIQAVIDGKAIAPYDIEFRQPEGRHIPLQVRLAPLKDARGTTVGVLATLEDLTMHRAAIEALRESEERFRRVFDAGPLGMALSTLTGEIVRVNDMLCRMLGYAPHELTGQPVEIMSHPDDLSADQDRAQRMLGDEHVSEHAERRYVRKDGSAIWASLTSTILYDEQGAPLYILDMIQDITERKRMEAAEREQRALAEALRDTAAVVNSTLNLEEVLDHILASVGRVVPHDAANIMLIESGVGRIVRARGYRERGIEEWAMSHPFPLAEVPNLAAMAGTRKPVMILDTHADPGWRIFPETIWVRSHLGAPICVEDEVIGFLLLDSEQTHAFVPGDASRLQAFADQAAIAIRNARLYAESQSRNRRLEMLNRVTRIGTEKLDLDDLLKTLAETVNEVIGGDHCFITLWDAERRVPIPVASSVPLPPGMVPLDFPPGSQTLTALALKERRPLVVPDIMTSPYLQDDVRTYLTDPIPTRSLLVLPLQTAERDIGAMLLGFREAHTFSQDEVAWAGQAADLMALAIAKAQAYAELEERVQQRTAQLTEANQRLMALSRMKDEFVSNVSHELRTPIASIKLYHHLLTARPDKQPTYLERLNRETERLEMIIEDLLYLSRMDQGQMPHEWEEIDLNRLVNMYTVDRGPLAERRGLTLVFEPDPSLPTVAGDQASLGRAIGVLLTNALNYTPAQGRVTVRTATHEVNGERWATVTVQDTGPGIPADERDHLFERFFRGRVGRESGAPGTGLGLAIAKQIVEHHGGTIELANTAEEEPGARFIISLPAIKDGD